MQDRGIRPGIAIGLFGKLPARGDFVRAGLPGSFVAPWDAWLAGVLAASRERLGAAWLPAFLDAPVWRFALGAGTCGGSPVLGLLLPSVDRVGRYFPLTLAAVLPAGAAAGDADAWLDACEAAGRAALAADLPPDDLAHRLPPLVATPAAAPMAGSAWWTEGGPRVPATRFARPGLPDAACFAAMLQAPATVDEGADAMEAGA